MYIYISTYIRTYEESVTYWNVYLSFPKYVGMIVINKYIIH